MTLRQRLEPIGQAYSAIVKNCYHYWRPKLPAPFLVWAEDGDNAAWADDRMMEQAITGTTDYFTRDEFDPAIDRIQDANQSLGIAWRLNSVQYEDDTELIHYEWSWEVH